jgi:hypothetical protein
LRARAANFRQRQLGDINSSGGVHPRMMPQPQRYA